MQVHPPQGTRVDELGRIGERNHFDAACICHLSAAYHDRAPFPPDPVANRQE
jgi:hypothetical protein